MAIKEADIKLLWGRAAGMCSRPGCGADLTAHEKDSNPYVVGEMAHVIARSSRGPRGDGQGGDDSYANLVLLCPTDHRHVDKAPEGEFPPELLHSWKDAHEANVRSLGSSEKFADFESLAKAIRPLLMRNKSIWRSFGPQSEAAQNDPSSNAHTLWELRRADTVVPNNRTMMNMIGANSKLLNDRQTEAFADFCAHAEAYEAHIANAIDVYPTFPTGFGEVFDNG